MTVFSTEGSPISEGQRHAAPQLTAAAPPRPARPQPPLPRWRPQRPHEDGGGGRARAAGGSGGAGAVAPSRPSMAEGPGGEARLPELLATGWRLWEEVEAGTEPSSGAPAVQDKVRQGLGALRQAAAMVAELDLFR